MNEIPKLVVTTEGGPPSEHPLTKSAHVLGRLTDCDLVLTDVQASRRHCRVENTAGAWFVLDLGSANGTIFNGQPLKERQPLQDGDTLVIGETRVVFRSNIARPVRRAGLMPPGRVDPNLSIVRLTDEAMGGGTTLQFTAAGAPVVSIEEASSGDVGKLKGVAKRLRLLVDIGQALGNALDPSALLTTSLDKLFEVFPQTERGIIVLYGPDGSLPAMLTPEGEHGDLLDRRKGALTRVKHRRPPAAGDAEIRLSRTVLGRVRAQRQAVLLSDSGAPAADAAMMSMLRLQVRSLLCAPLLAGDRDLGIIQLETKSGEHAFTTDDLALLSAVAGQIAVVVFNAELALDAAASAAQRENLSRFLSPQIVEEVLKGTMGLALGGTEKKGTIFFSDIVGFTRMAAKMRPHDVVTLLNRYFTVMQEVVFRRGGSIDKCAGDQIMAHWGVIGDQPDFTAQAATAAVEMQLALFAFNRDEALKQDIVLPSEPVAQGIGLNTGTVCAGNIGSERKIEFTVIGDTVNVSARVEAMAGRTQTFLTEATWRELEPRTLAIRMPDMPAKNVEHPVPVYSLRGIVPPPMQGPTSAPGAMLNHLLLALPCQLRMAAKAGPSQARVAGMVTRITLTPGGGARIVVQMVIPLPVDAEVVLEWLVAEKPTLPPLRGFVENCWDPENPTGAAADAGVRAHATDLEDTSLTSRPPEPGTLTLRVLELSPELAAWRPGTLLRSDLTRPEEIVRA